MGNATGRRWILVIVAIALAVPAGWAMAGRDEARAFPDLAGRVLLAGCRQGQCVWARVVRVETVSATARGELRRVVQRAGTSSHGDDVPDGYSASVPVRWEARDSSSYAFCSTARPGYAFPDESGRYVLHYLDLFDLAGYQYSSATMYMRICHDLAFDPENAAALRSLGYRPGTRSEQVEDGAPEDLAR